MPSTTVRISHETLQVLRELAQQLGEPMPKILTRAVEAYRRQQVLERTNIAYAALRADPVEWQRQEEERRLWDVTLGDDLNEP